jgi:hypothetical protein
MKYRHLRGVAHNFGHSFVSRENYDGVADDYVMGQLACADVSSGEPELCVDVRTGHAGPPALLTQVVRLSVARYAAWFPRLLADHGIAAQAVARAEMRVRFDLSRVGVPGFTGPFMLPFQCIVQITDDHGRVHHGTINGAWPVRLRNTPSPSSPAPAGR